MAKVDPEGRQASAVAEGAVAICKQFPALCAGAAAAVTKWWIDHCPNGMAMTRPKNPPDIGPPNGWVQGPRRGRKYGPDGKPEYDLDKPHQGNDADHVHEWPDGVREEPGRPASPWPRGE